MKFKDKLDSDIGMFLGLAIGDALGAPLEFQPARDPDNYVTKYMTGGAHNVSKGEFTDDTSMALAMADAFITSKAFDGKLIMHNFLKWMNEGEYSPRGVMFDCGTTILQALRKFEKDQTNPFAGSKDKFSAGNGGLMRLAPAIIFAQTKKEAVQLARDTTRLTHGASEAVFFSEIFAKELFCREISDDLAEYKHPKDFSRENVLSGGYVKETYQAAWWAFQTTNSFEDCVISAVNRGYDSDTTGAVAGMIAGCFYGYGNIPVWMIDDLQWNEEIIMYSRKLHNLAQERTNCP